jgi:hypothetical protein
MRKDSIPMSVLFTPYICRLIEGIYHHKDPRQAYPRLTISLRAISGTEVAGQSISESHGRLVDTRFCKSTPWASVGNLEYAVPLFSRLSHFVSEAKEAAESL